MSRTYKSTGLRYFRKPRTQNSRIVEGAAIEALEDEDYVIRHNRLQHRSSLSGAIPTSYDDINFSTYPKHKKQ